MQLVTRRDDDRILAREERQRGNDFGARSVQPRLSDCKLRQRVGSQSNLLEEAVASIRRRERSASGSVRSFPDRAVRRVPAREHAGGAAIEIDGMRRRAFLPVPAAIQSWRVCLPKLDSRSSVRRATLGSAFDASVDMAPGRHRVSAPRGCGLRWPRCVRRLGRGSRGQQQRQEQCEQRSHRSMSAK